MPVYSVFCHLSRHLVSAHIVLVSIKYFVICCDLKSGMLKKWRYLSFFFKLEMHVCECSVGDQCVPTVCVKYLLWMLPAYY